MTLASVARTLSLLFALAALSFVWPHLIPGDWQLLMGEGSGIAVVNTSVKPAITGPPPQVSSLHTLISGQSIFPILAHALGATLLWSLPALGTAFFIALITAALSWGGLLVRLSAALPLIVLAPWIYVFAPGWVSFAPFALLAFHWWGPWHRLIAERLVHSHHAPFVQAAQARGIHGWNLFWRYRWLPVAPACLAQISTQAGHVLSGSVLLEILFRRPGLGSLIFDSVLRRDLPLVQWSLLTATFLAFGVQRLASGHSR